MDQAYIKWEEQTYADATWSDKTPKDSPYFPAFMSALKRFMQFRKFVVPTVKSSTELAKLDAPRRESSFSALEKQPDFIPHQLVSFRWTRYMYLNPSAGRGTCTSSSGRKPFRWTVHRLPGGVPPGGVTSA
ncbi:hypothetical protein PGT21_009088 [Puccinia graminis f. sp. tritici]|uniref:Uncharacterized protein n=1 Tax=Puccinia graminis f. sp. tritici TaxID=56615 RepID=A0A5B0NMU9_PUCGR|nr:hypothetical protein PGT21_009088 [Puccinia graminis f. sp. tritici]